MLDQAIAQIYKLLCLFGKVLVINNDKLQLLQDCLLVRFLCGLHKEVRAEVDHLDGLIILLGDLGSVIQLSKSQHSSMVENFWCLTSIVS